MPDAALFAMVSKARTAPDLHALYEDHADHVRGLLARLLGPGGDPDDVTQEVFLVAMRRLGSLRDEAGARRWLCAIALKLALAARRKRALRRFVGLDAAEDLAGPARADDAFEAAEASRRTYALLERVGEKKRTVFILYELQGLSGEEIAALVRCPLKTVWTRLHHARREFATALQRTLARDAEEQK